eukprot:CAMPEP_0170352880 /NCGR_PEP_ID=MMETSP0116_2-20130129/77755_1 /TAXON_ID=400756 /ORGANISM="Durinskia baltica, Strain CSIRO CS-38" /LENGTH=203 /DNA_ID=CAMNT_0010606813 /DNA_START=60 /DNA_END=669 /DNA_ORIENTATION=+
MAMPGLPPQAADFQTASGGGLWRRRSGAHGRRGSCRATVGAAFLLGRVGAEAAVASARPPQRPSASAFDLVLPPPSELPRLTDCPEIAPPRPIEGLLKELAGMLSDGGDNGPPSNQELAELLGLVEVEVDSVPIERWPPVDQEDLDQANRMEPIAKEVARATIAEAAAFFGAMAEQVDAKVREEEELRRRHDWSVERRLLRPS